MSAWGKANKIEGDDILFLSDPGTSFSRSIGWLKGERTGRYAIVIDKGLVTYAEVETGGDVTVRRPVFLTIYVLKTGFLRKGGLMLLCRFLERKPCWQAYRDLLELTSHRYVDYRFVHHRLPQSVN